MKKKEKIFLLESSLKDMLAHYDRETCTHEETYRGGAIWTVCSQCGKKWADDEGGFIPYMEPVFVTLARELVENNL